MKETTITKLSNDNNTIEIEERMIRNVDGKNNDCIKLSVGSFEDNIGGSDGEFIFLIKSEVEYLIDKLQFYLSRMEA